MPNTAVPSWLRACVLACAPLAFAVSAHASGTPEQMLQVLMRPGDATKFAVRYGTPTRFNSGYLFTQDGGKTFRAACSDLIADEVQIARSNSQFVAANVMDGMGRITVSEGSGELYTDDGTGCSFTKDDALGETNNANALVLDPSDAKVLYALVTAQTMLNSTETTLELRKRDAMGAWSTAGTVKPLVRGQGVFGTDLVVTRLPSGALRFVALYTVYVEGDTTPEDNFRTSISDDGGKTWQERAAPMVPNTSNLRLVGFDPTNPDRVLAAQYGSSIVDQLLLSSDKGATFSKWADVGEFSSVSFGKDGAVYVSDAGDSASNNVGGLLRAAKVGEPLMRVGSTQYLQCAYYQPSNDTLYVCNANKFGTMDPSTGEFTQLTTFNDVKTLLDCPGVDAVAECKEQLNTGTSWCCAGHYPFAEFCGSYDVTTVGTKTVFCGEAGRAYERMVRGEPDGGAGGSAGDGGVRDAGGAMATRDAAVRRDASAGSGDAGQGRSDDEDDEDEDEPRASPAKGGDDGCSLDRRGGGGGALSSMLAALGLLGLQRRRSRRSRRPEA